MRLLRKSINTCYKTLRYYGYIVDSYEPNTLEASMNNSGVCIKWVKLYFSPAGRCIKIEEH